MSLLAGPFWTPCPAALALQFLAGISSSAYKAPAADALSVDAQPFKAIVGAVVPCCPSSLFVAGLLPLGAVEAALPYDTAGSSCLLIFANSSASGAPEFRGRAVAINPLQNQFGSDREMQKQIIYTTVNLRCRDLM